MSNPAYKPTSVNTPSSLYVNPAYINSPVVKALTGKLEVVDLPTMQVVKLHKKATLPTVAHPGEDLGYDVYALHDYFLWQGQVTRIPTGIAIELPGYGFIMRDRSSMALRGVTLSGGVIDAGYRGEIFVNLTFQSGGFAGPNAVEVKAGEKIAQLVPYRPLTNFQVVEAKELSDSSRGALGYGSTGR